MISKKQALILGAAVVGGTGIGLMILKGKEEEDGGEPVEESKKQALMISYDAPVYAPSEVYAPYTENTITDIVHNIITKIVPPPPPTPPPDPTPAPPPPPTQPIFVHPLIDTLPPGAADPVLDAQSAFFRRWGVVPPWETAAVETVKKVPSEPTKTTTSKTTPTSQPHATTAGRWSR